MKKNILIIILLSLLILLSVQAQTAYKNQFAVHIGLPYTDGLISLNKNPTIGFAYERKLSKWFSIATHLSSFYQNYSDFYLVENSNYPTIDVHASSKSPFMTEEQRKLLAQQGVKKLNYDQIIKSWAVPIDLGLWIYPLHLKHHQAGVNIGFSMTYENRNYWRDYFSGTLTLKDGSEEKILLSVPTEYRNFSPGFTTKVKYQYCFKRSAIGARISNYNLIYSSIFNISPNDTYWDKSIFFTYQF